MLFYFPLHYFIASNGWHIYWIYKYLRQPAVFQNNSTRIKKNVVQQEEQKINLQFSNAFGKSNYVLNVAAKNFKNLYIF